MEPKEELFIDFETYSGVELKRSNVYRYSEVPSFRAIMGQHALGDAPVTVLEEGALYDSRCREMVALREMVLDPEVLKVAHNAGFDRIVASTLVRPTNGARYLHPAHWHDTMSVAMSQGLPANLEALARVLGGEQKDTAGTRLINLFSKPVKGRRVMPQERPEDWEAFRRYGSQDVEALRTVHRRLGGFQTVQERVLYTVDQLVNDRGIRADLALARKAVAAAEANRAAALEQMRALTGVDNPNSTEQLHTWLRAHGLRLDDMTADTIEETLEDQSLDPVIREVLELRQIVALVAAQKYQAIVRGISADGRLRGQFRFLGAHTGRWSGRGVQLQNLPRLTLKPEALEDAGITPEAAKEMEDEEVQAITDAYTRVVLQGLALGRGATPHELKALVRPMFVGPLTEEDPTRLGISDYAAIEARAIAWEAGEEWALEAFRAGRDIYTETAKRMGNLSRQQGKVAVLALGYQGAVGSLRVMGAQGSDAALRRLVDQWREANPAIVRFWRDLDRTFRTGGTAGEVSVVKAGRDRHILLPSGRWLVYKDVRFTTEEGPYGPRTRASFWDYRKAYGRGARIATYGGRLAENVTQAISRDVLAEAMIRLERAGFRTVGHVHDEVIVELRNPDSLPEVKALMCVAPAWAQDFPMDTSGFITDRYRKD